MKKIYLIQSGHHRNDLESLPMFDSMTSRLTLSTDINVSLVEGLAKKYGADHYFSDGMTADEAAAMNTYIDKLLSSDEYATKWLQDSSDGWRKRNPHHFKTMKTLYGLQRGGIPIRSYPTDDEKLLNESEELFAGRVKRVGTMLQIIQKMGEPGATPALRDELSKVLATLPSPEEALYLERASADFVERRDDVVLENLKKYAGEQNILFMGGFHRLKKLREDNTFSLYPVRIGMDDSEENTIKVTGLLPKDSVAVVENIQKKIPESVWEINYV